MEASLDATLKGADTDSGKGGSIESVVTAIDNDTPTDTLPPTTPDTSDDFPESTNDLSDSEATTNKDEDFHAEINDVFEDSDSASLEYDDECTTFAETLSLASRHSSTGEAAAQNSKINEKLTISAANVTGFRTIKPQDSTPNSGAKEQHPDYAFIVEVEWSDGRKNVVTRTYSDFCSFHCYLLDEFARLAEKASGSEGMRMNLYLPVHMDKSECDLIEAEKRELQLHKYVQDLVKLPHQLSASPTVLTFFESRNSDPRPYAEVEAQMNMTTFNNTANHYVICWIDS